MQLENMMEMYLSRVSEERQQTYLVVGDLESLSASALYGYGNGGDSGGRMTIRPLGNTQIHIHEGAGGSANIKYRDGTRTPISSYDVAMIDSLLDSFGMSKIQTTTKGSNKGRK